MYEKDFWVGDYWVRKETCQKDKFFIFANVICQILLFNLKLNYEKIVVFIFYTFRN